MNLDSIYFLAIMYCAAAAIMYLSGIATAVIAKRAQSGIWKANIWLFVYFVMLFLGLSFCCCACGFIFGLGHYISPSDTFAPLYPQMLTFLYILAPYFTSIVFLPFWLGYAFKKHPREIGEPSKAFRLRRLRTFLKILSVCLTGLALWIFMESEYVKDPSIRSFITLTAAFILAAVLLKKRRGSPKSESPEGI